MPGSEDEPLPEGSAESEGPGESSPFRRVGRILVGSKRAFIEPLGDSGKLRKSPADTDPEDEV
jgi:hypothetical protein